MKGKFIVFEGLDRVGKSTQINLLSSILTLDEIKHKVYKFPARATTTWSLIDLYNSQLIDLHPKSAHLLFSANRWELQEELIKYLNAGYFIVADRYFYSGTAYTCGAFDVDFSWCLQPDAGLIMPDLVFYLDVPEHVRLLRLDKNERHEDVETQRKIERVYKQFEGPSWIKIDGNDTVNNVSETIQRHVRNLISQST